MPDGRRVPADYYARLGVSPDANQHAIKKAFRRKAKTHHPDRAPAHRKEEATRHFMALREAFDVLSDPEARATYDAARTAEAPRAPQSAPTAASTRAQRRESFARAWHEARQSRAVWRRSATRSIQSSLYEEHRQIYRHHESAVRWGSIVGAGLFVAEPNIIYSTDYYLLNMLLCAVAGGAVGFVLSTLWGVLSLIVRPGT
ncbi:J domain-containing protein [Salisaeta longa]|uniref:J domain-containing protein n=1 Tax=Salisaeta longa TaxID=503170 RepID=UPI0003B5FC72|nr:J domain-containing protein [Salisaeta longa]